MVSYQALGFGVIAHILCLYLATLFFYNLLMGLPYIISMFGVSTRGTWEECDITVWRSEH
jgi:hypothetical protein